MPDGTSYPLAIGLPGDREVDAKRLEAVLEPGEVTPFDEADFAANPALVKGYIGPGALGSQAASGIRYLLDPRVVTGTRWITGADESGRHVFDLVTGRDFAGDGVIDVAEVRAGDPCPACAAAGRDGVLAEARGIEIGHIFQLGRKYAQALDLTVLDENGKQVVVTMGSYGIGVTRAVAAIAEQHHDDRGLVWPREVPRPTCTSSRRARTTRSHEAAEKLAGDLVARGVRVLLDDRRGVSPGVKFNDSELIGVPLIVVVGKRLAQGTIEVKDRASGAREDLAVDGAADDIVERVQALP